MPPDDHWMLDKKIPAAVITTLVVQILGFAWYAAKLDSRVEALDGRITKSEAQLTLYERDARDVGNRLVRLEEKSAAMLDILKRVERAIDRRSDESGR